MFRDRRAYLSNNSVTQADLRSLISTVHAALCGAANGKQAPEKVALPPPVSVKKSISPDYLFGMEDRKRYKSLKRHLTARRLTPPQHREKWSLPVEYPMVAPSYAKARSALAKDGDRARSETGGQKRQKERC